MKGVIRMSFRFATTLAFALGFEIASTFGQTEVGRFVISGTVMDQSGASIPGAAVKLRSRTNGQEQDSITRENGYFRFERVSAGRYEVMIQKPSFKAISVGVVVRNRDPETLKISLQIAQLSEVVVAKDREGQVNTDPAENLDVVGLDRKALDDLPVLDQDVVGALSRFLDGSALGSGGVTLVVDGLQTSEKGVSASAIQEVKINQNPYSAEFSRPGRGRIEITTKAGASAYHGSFNFLFRDYHLDARNAFALERPPEQRRIYEGHLTGPVGHSKKTSFLISANHEEEDLQSVIYASTVTGLFRENAANPQRQTELSARLNHEFSKKNTVSIRYEFADDATRNGGVGGFSLPEVAWDTSDREHHLYYNQRTVLSSKLVNELFIRSGSHDNRTRSLRAGVRRIVVQDAFTGGGGQADRRATENHVQLSDTVAWLHGRHSIKAGINIPDISRRGSSDRTNFNGTYTFSSLDDYVRGTPFSFQSNQGDPHLAFWQMEFGAFVQDDYRLRPNLSIGLGLRYDVQNYLPDHNNFAPRISFAFSPDGKRKTVLRGGAGLFYDRTGEGAIGDVLRFDGYRLRQFLITNPGYPDPWLLGTNLIEIPSSVVRLARAIRSPYAFQYGVGVERQLRKSTTLSASYTEIRGVKLFLSRDVNAPFPPLYQRPDLSLGRVRQIESSAGSRSRSLELMLRGNLSRFFNGTIQYTTGRAYNSTSGINSVPADSYDLSGEWSRADFDERHRFNMLGTFKVKKLFSLGASASLSSGRPYGLTLGRDANHDGSASDRPSGVRRNSLQGPGSATLDLRWSRELRLTHKKKEEGPIVAFALNVFNVLNRVNYAGYVGNLSSPFFGLPVASRPARRMQIALRFEF